MIIKDLKSAAAHVISVTNTATKLFDLLDTAGGADQEVPGKINALDLYVTEDIRISWDPNVAPTATEGFLLKPGFYQFRNRPVAHLRLIRVGSSNVICNVVVGSSDPYESEMFAPTDLSFDMGEVSNIVTDSYKTYESAAISSSPTEYDVAVDLGRASISGALVNTGTVNLTIAMETESDGGGFGDDTTVEAGGSFDFTGLSVYTLKVSAPSGTGEFTATFR